MTISINNPITYASTHTLRPCFSRDTARHQPSIDLSVLLSTSPKPKCELTDFLPQEETNPDIIRVLEKSNPTPQPPALISSPPRHRPCLSPSTVTGFYAVFHVSRLEPIDCALRTVSDQHVGCRPELYLMRLDNCHQQRTGPVHAVSLSIRMRFL